MLYAQLDTLITQSLCDSEATYERSVARMREGDLTKDENPASHFSTHFAPANFETGEVFIIDHKKARTWLFPGGHIDRGEGLLDTLNREIEEELGVRAFYQALPEPFLITMAEINQPNRPCKEHFDIWFLMATDGYDFNLNPEEWHDARWMTFDEAHMTLTHPNNLLALEKILTLQQP